MIKNFSFHSFSFPPSYSTHSQQFILGSPSEHLLYQCKQLSGGFPPTKITARYCTQGLTYKYTQSESPRWAEKEMQLYSQPHWK